MRLACLRPLALAITFVAVAVPLACGSDDDSTFDDGAGDSGTDAMGNDPGFAIGNNDGGQGGQGDGGRTDASDQIVMTIRDFKFWDASDPTTTDDFENPPYDIGQDGRPSQGYRGDWNDTEIVTDTLGPDNKPVYKATTKTLTTHGKTSFARWFNDVDGGNIAQYFPLVTTTVDGGASEYDSNKSGRPYDATKPNGDKGFFPIDDGTPTATPWGNQGQTHNFSFTGEIHTVFTYRGGEFFNFRGDDDVFVYINKKRVINLGGIHGPKTANVKVDDLGLTIGQDYPLDFFFAERHVSGSNVLFQTTLALRAAPPGGIK